jgi:arylformamidase
MSLSASAEVAESMRNDYTVDTMKRIIDLSYTISDGMPVFPGDPGVEFKRVHAIHEGGYNVTRISMGAHTGTHIDSPHHVMHDDRGVDSFAPDALVGWAEVLDLTSLAGPGHHIPDQQRALEITSADLDVFAGRVTDGARLLIKTGWGKRWGSPDFYKGFPGISEGAAAWLTARKVKLLGIEQPSVHATLHREVHKALLASGMVVLETVANLHEVASDRVYLAALPMKLAGLDGAPTRVVAIEGIEATE